MSQVDVAVVGAGLVGLAAARELLVRRPEMSLVVLEREAEPARHQSGRNSGVIHAGIYYEPGSLKARLCVEGARALYEYCAEREVRAERCGKLVVARDEAERRRLDELERRGRANGVPDLRRLGAAELQEVEPGCRGVGALHSPHTGVVDFAAVARALASDVCERGGSVINGCAVRGLRPGARRVALDHARGTVEARGALVCAGAWSDRLAVRAGAPADPRIVPFRGSYLRLRAERRSLVRGQIYPVPDPRLPFLGVHLSRGIDGQVTVGPTALLSPSRALGGAWRALPQDLLDTLAWPGTWRLARRFWRTGLGELRLAANPRALARDAASYVPALEPDDLERGFTGVRAQALARNGRLLDDFALSHTERALHVRNAPSPAATSCLALAKLIADRTEQMLA